MADVSGHPSTPPRWVAVCLPGQCADGSVVYDRDDQNDRNEWARLHRRRLGHRVLTFQLPALERVEYT